MAKKSSSEFEEAIIGEAEFILTLQWEDDAIPVFPTIKDEKAFISPYGGCIAAVGLDAALPINLK